MYIVPISFCENAKMLDLLIISYYYDKHVAVIINMFFVLSFND